MQGWINLTSQLLHENEGAATTSEEEVVGPRSELNYWRRCAPRPR